MTPGSYPASTTHTLRCAIYTRKSHEEGLDQAFNSPDAQREAGIDYINSQKHEGWEIVDHRYDDGGYSGGNMDRPALTQLLDDIKHGEVDVVVVYKVDRLSRSLHDFARMMQVFDEQKVSFVSVTQQFNTTTSMGRLTLNMLLSFAQFEREVTGERIRDKIAATKKKGLWVGGQPPLGYRLEDRQLHIVQNEARLVEDIFRGYLEQQSLIDLADRFNGEGYTTKRWHSTRDKEHGGKPLTPKYLHRVLTNPLYIGKIVHKGKVWKGQHEPIVERKLWDRVQKAIDTRNNQSRHRWDQPHLLKGRLRTHEEFAMSPTSVHRPSAATGASGGGGKRLVRYYVSQKGYKNCPIKTINARYLDGLVRALVLGHLSDEAFDPLRRSETQIRDHWVRAMIHRVCLAPDQLTVELDTRQIEICGEQDWPKTEGEQTSEPMPTCLYKPKVQKRRHRVILTLPIQIKRLDGKRMLLSPDGQDLFVSGESEPKDHIVRAIGNAYYWRQLFEQEALTLTQLAERLGMSTSYVRKYLPLINLSPDILKRALTGQLPPRITLLNLLEAAKHLDWMKQSAYLGLKPLRLMAKRAAKSSRTSRPFNSKAHR